MSKTIIVSNRLPIKINKIEGKLVYRQSEGGLATGLSGIYCEGDNIWVGWPGIADINPTEQKEVVDRLVGQNLVPVFLDTQEISEYYEGFSNEVLWPICHYMTSYARYKETYLESYQKVNLKMAEAVLSLAESGDIVWVHDYHLLLLPKLVRQEKKGLQIGFFQHIPFPSYEIFRQIPWRHEILEGMLSSDLIGFHTYDDIRHFISAATRIMSIKASANQLMYKNRLSIVDAFPMSIDFDKFNAFEISKAVKSNILRIMESVHRVRLVISVDRLDYSKGIVKRLEGFELFIKKYPEFKEKVSLLMVVVPSRDNVLQYKELKEEIDRMVSDINARNQTLNWQPIYYFYRSFSEEMLSAIYKAADVCLVTPLRDGMNLVSKEFVASRTDQSGVLILSEMAGSSKELPEAIIINPNDIHAFAKAISRALCMPLDEQKQRMQLMRETVQKFNIYHWVAIFMDRLQEVKTMQQSLSTNYLNSDTLSNIHTRYKEAINRILFLDYDGTLVGFQQEPLLAVPDKDLLTLINKLAKDPANRVVIISGRKHENLFDWFTDIPVDIIAEHGAWVKRHQQAWHCFYGLNDDWKSEIKAVMERFTDRTPGTFIEEKSFSLVWHFRKAEYGLGEQRAMELEDNLKFFASDKNLQIIQGKKVIEIKSSLVNKGKAAAFWAAETDYDFIFSMGDDDTDEDIFKSLPLQSINIKVGSNVSSAKYYVNTYQEAREVLGVFVGGK